MRTFSIKELETLCEVKAHTIRVWEKRYGVFQPQRTSANARRYTTADLDKLLSLVLLNKSGYKISSSSQLSSEEVTQQLRHLTQTDERLQRAVNELISCMYALDVMGFESVLDTAFLSWQIDTVITKIIYPFLQKVGLLCQGSRTNEEHFVVTAIRKKFYWSIQRTVVNKKRGKTVLLFLTGERQLDLLLLYMYYCLEAAGWHVIHLGVDVSVNNIEDFLRVQKVDCLLTYFSKKSSVLLTELSERLAGLAPHSKLLVLKGHKCVWEKETERVLAMDTDAVLSFLETSQEVTTQKEALELMPVL